MTSTKVIGREVMIERLVRFNRERIKKAMGNFAEQIINEKLSYFTQESYSTKSTRAICKEYDLIFGLDKSADNAADYDTPTPCDNIKNSAALMG
jgi:protein-tyrosine-phosphatase